MFLVDTIGSNDFGNFILILCTKGTKKILQFGFMKLLTGVEGKFENGTSLSPVWKWYFVQVLNHAWVTLFTCTALSIIGTKMNVCFVFKFD